MCKVGYKLVLQDISEELAAELDLRQTLSADIKAMINLLIATNTDLSCCGWLVRGLLEVWKMKSKKVMFMWVLFWA